MGNYRFLLLAGLIGAFITLALPLPAHAQQAMPSEPKAEPEPVGSKKALDPLAGNQIKKDDKNTGATTGILPVTKSEAPAASSNPNDVPPPAPGGGVMQDGQIPPISADLLALTPEEQQEQALENARTKAFDGTLRNALPLEPDEIKSVINRYEETTKAVEQPFQGKTPTPEIRVETISLEPSALPATIRLAPGHVTSLTMLDATGQPWPVADVSWGGDFEVQAPQEGGHIIRISPLGGYKVGNISLRLVDMPTPVTFTLQTTPDVVDYRFDARIPIRGPNALAEVIDTPTPTTAGDGNMMMVLDGTPPDGSLPLEVSGVDGRTSAYKVGAKVYVRTPYSMLSPAWSEQSSSSDGMRVYVIPETPALLLSDQGKMVRASIAPAPMTAPEPTEGSPL